MINFKNLKKTFFVAEVGNNHEGNYKSATRLIDYAKKSGVDAVKFQTYQTNCFIHSSEKKRFKKLKSFELSKNDFKKLSIYTKKKNLKFISTPFDLDSAKFLSKIVDIFKISSGDNNYFDLIKLCASFKKPLIISLGLLNLKEIRAILNLLKKNKFPLEKLILLHCVSNYPVKDNKANLLSIKYLIDNLPVSIGYSDHVIGVESCYVAVCMGAKLIEKHFTLDNNYSSFRDHKLSLNPKDMKKMISSAKRIEKMFGSYHKKKSYDEKKNETSMRRSLYFNSNLEKGKIIENEDIKILRPYKSTKPNDIYKIIGKKLIKKVKKSQEVSFKFFK